MKIYTLIFLISLSACGFKPLNQLSEKKNFFINNIEINGEKRISYIVKNEILLNSSTKSENKINIKLNIKKKKQIKEKNIAGKISSYTITLNADLIVEDKKNLKKIKKNFLKSSVYSTSSNHSDTLANEKNTLENLTETLTEDIINFLKIYLNN